MSSVDDDLENEIIEGKDEKSELANVVDTLLNDKWGRRKTRLAKRVVTKLSTIDTLAQIYDVKFLKHWIQVYTEYVTSIDGAGRKEIVDITKFTIDRESKRDKEMINALGRR